jgi:RimJ/RimL family protein N-acetyltransferase
MLGPTLVGEVVRLEPPQDEDLPTLRRYFNDMETLHLVGGNFPETAKQWEENHKAAAGSQNLVIWSIWAGDQLIGITSIRDINWIARTGITGTTIGLREARGKGYGSEMVGLRTRYAFEDLGLQRLESETLAENIAMHRALQKSGYREIGRKRRFAYFGGQFHDMVIWEVLVEDWKALQGS